MPKDLKMDARLIKTATPEVWGGIESTIVRLQNNYKDQLALAGHYSRDGALANVASLGIKAMRYPVLWEKHEQAEGRDIDWQWAESQLLQLKQCGIKPIAGLLHHGSGPRFTSLIDDAFPQKFALYAGKVAQQFPWLEYYTPVNEPMTTARFSGMYGLWYPHHTSANSFLKMLLNQLKATVLAMQAIRQTNPYAKLIQTEDLSKTHSTPLLQYQADFENLRRWASYDILCGKLDKQHPLWPYFMENGIDEASLAFFCENPCPPDIMGFNYYVTSERYLDHNTNDYPPHRIGGNGKHTYADLEAARHVEPDGVQALLTEAWERFKIPVAITEVQLKCSREEQLRWFKEVWDGCCAALQNGVAVKAVTAWSLMGAYDWDSLLVKNNMSYEPGAFDLSGGEPRPTALAKMIRSLASAQPYKHPLLEEKGWWHRHNPAARSNANKAMRPLLLIGKYGTLANAFMRICAHRGIAVAALSRKEIDICSTQSTEQAFDIYKPWAVINASGFVRVDDAETLRSECYALNAEGPAVLAACCQKHGLPFLTFSSDLVFNGDKKQPYHEHDEVAPLNIYGLAKAQGERDVIDACPHSLVIRSSAFFGPWDKYNFAYQVIEQLKHGGVFEAVSNVVVSPTYVPDLVEAALDIFIDEEAGIWHLSNRGQMTWQQFAEEVAGHAKLDKTKIAGKQLHEMAWPARRPPYSVLQNRRGIVLPMLDDAINRYFVQKAV